MARGTGGLTNDRIDLGKAAGPYHVIARDGANVYWREFAKRYVYVNPTVTNAAAIVLPAACKELTHDSLKKPVADLAETQTLDL